MMRTIGGCLSATALLLFIGASAAGEVDEALEKAMTDVEATGAAISIGSASDSGLDVDHDTYRADDPFFDVLPKLESLRSLKLGFTKRVRDRELLPNALKRIGACKQLEKLDIEFLEMEFEDLVALDALPRLKSLSIRCVNGDPMPDIYRFLKRPEAAKLESISLSVDQVGDEVCEALAAIPNLRDFDFRSPTTDFSEDGLAALAKKGNLRSIALRGSSVPPEGLSALAVAKDLESLECTMTELGDDGLSIVAGFSKLRRLNISHTGVTNLHALRGMTSLEHVDVQGCRLGPGGLEYLAPLVNLKYLDVSGCGLDNSDAKVLGSLTNLESLSLSGNDQITHDGIAQLAKLVNLKSLTLDGISGFADGLNDFRNLAKLERLFVSSEAITPPGIKVLENFHNLRELNLSGCPVGGGLAAIRNLKSLRSLRLRGCDVQDEDLVNFAGLRKLRYLDLDMNDDLSDAGIAYLAGLTNLLSLDLKQISLTDESCRHLQRMTRMHSLSFGASELTDEGLASFTNMSAMYRLQLSGSVTLNESGLASLQQLKGLHILSIQLSEDSRISVQELIDAFPATRIHVNGRRYQVNGAR